MSIIETINTAISDHIDKSSELYTVWIGDEDFTPEVTIDESSDYNCGAVCNELEFVRLVSDYYVSCLSVDDADSEELEGLIDYLIDMPRRSTAEPDARYRNRFKFIVVEKANNRRTTRWAIRDAISYFIADMDTVQLVEKFDNQSLYFEVRFEGASTDEDTIFINNVEQAFIDQNFIGGIGIGEVVSYIGELIQRIKAAGVDFDVAFIEQNRTTLSSDCIIGSVQVYVTSDARIKATLSQTKTSDAQITT